MRRFIICFGLLFVSFYGFAQQNLPSKIYGGIPNPGSAALYQIQVGAYSSAQNAASVFVLLRNSGLNPVSETQQNLTKVIIPEIPAGQIPVTLERIKRLGFNEVIIRENKAQAGGYAAPEIRNIPAPQSGYSSSDAIYVSEYGNVKIRKPDGTEIDISFPLAYPPERPARVTHPERPAKARPEREETVIQRPQETNFLCREWKVVNCTNEEFIGDVYNFSFEGALLVTKKDGSSSTGLWRWCNDKYEEWEYTHHNWQSYGRVKNNALNWESLVFTTPNYYASVDGYSSANQDDVYELVPVR